MLIAKYEKELEERLEIEREFLGDTYDKLEKEQLYSDEEPVEFFYLWDIHEESFQIYRTVRQWEREDGLLDSNLVIALAKEKCINLEKLLIDLPLIHYGFKTRITPAQEITEQSK